MIDFITIKDWHAVWKLCTETGDVSRLFDDKVPYSRQGMKHRIRDIVDDHHNKAFEIVFDGAKAGCFIMYDLKDGVYEIHILLRKGFRGRKGIIIGKAGTNFALSMEGVSNLVSFCPESIPESFMYASMVGWRSLGYLPMKWLKGGVEYNVKGVCAI